MTRVITGLTVISVPQGTRLGFTYSDINDDGITTNDNAKGSIIVLDKDVQSHIDALKEYVFEWLEERD